MNTEHRAGLAARIVGIVIIEYAVVVAGCLLVLHRLALSTGAAASAGAALFSVLTVLNFLLARRLFRARPAPEPALRDESEEVARLREEFHYLRWYLDELVENWNTAVLVLDRSLLVRWMNRAGRDLLSLREKAELVGRSFRVHPLAGAAYRGQVSAFRGRSLHEALASCCEEGTPVLLEKVAYRRSGGGDPVPLDILATPWGEKPGETSRLVLRLDRSAPEKAAAPGKSGGGGERVPSRGGRSNGDLRAACAGLRGRLEALRLSCRSVADAAGPDGNGLGPEALLLEIQADRIGEEMERLERMVDADRSDPS